jgi:DNA polymerase III alpha subunit
MSNIVSVVELGDEDTYDLEVEHPDHQFYLSSGILTSNSHAVSYAIDSYYCAWLLTHYEEEWICAYLDTVSSDSKKLKMAIGEAKEMGYEIVPIDINYAGKSWTLLPGRQLMPSLTACKGVGEIAVDEILANRPFNSIEEFLWDEKGQWRPSKCNKSTVSSLIKAKAFNSVGVVGPGRPFDNYNQMHSVIVDNWSDFRKVLKSKPDFARNRLKELTVMTSGMPDWSPSEIAKNYVSLFGSFDASDIVDKNLLRKLASKGIRSIDDAEETVDLHWFVVCKSTPKKTKNGKPYLLFDAIGDSGVQKRVYCWNWPGGDPVPDYSLVVAEVTNGDFGCATKFHKLKVLQGQSSTRS